MRHSAALALTCGLLVLRPQPAPAVEPAQVVSSVVAKSAPWQPTLEAVANLRARLGADLAFQAAGIVSELDFRPGQDVAAGTVLAQLRLNDEPGVLAQYRAQAALDQITFGRDTKLFQSHVVSAAAIDGAYLTLQIDQARVIAEQGLIDTKTLRAPFAGRLGIQRVDPGQYLQPGTTVVTLQALDDVYADFYVPQKLAGRLKNGETVGVSVDAWPGRSFAGAVIAVMPQVDALSRTILVRASLDNREHALIPGMFATVRLAYARADPRVTLPKTAIVFSTYGDSVWKIRRGTGGDPDTVHQVTVTTGESRGDQVAVLSGVRDGEEVVSAGQVKLYENAPVAENNAIQPDAGADPHPGQE